MSADAPPQTQATNTKPEESQSQSQSQPQRHSGDYAPYPKLDPTDVAPPQQPLNTESRAPISEDAATTMPKDSNPYVTPAPVPASSTKSNSFTLSLFSFFLILLFTTASNLWVFFLRSYFRFRERRSREMGEESRRGHQEGRGSRRQHVAALYVFISSDFFFFLSVGIKDRYRDSQQFTHSSQRLIIYLYILFI